MAICSRLQTLGTSFNDIKETSENIIPEIMFIYDIEGFSNTIVPNNHVGQITIS